MEDFERRCGGSLVAGKPADRGPPGRWGIPGAVKMNRTMADMAGKAPQPRGGAWATRSRLGAAALFVIAGCVAICGAHAAPPRGSPGASTAATATAPTGRAAAFRDSLSRAHDLIKRGHFAAPEVLARNLAPAEEASAAPDSLRIADGLDLLVESLWRGGKGKQPSSRQLGERALGIRERALGPNHPDVATSLSTLAILLSVNGDYAAARPLFER